jgi:hypothetical protein
MANFSVFLTALESKLLEHTTANPSDWIDNLVEWRVRIAQDDYLPTAIEQLKASGATSIPATRDEIILAVDLPAKDPNWTPIERDDPNDDLVVEYTFHLEDDDIKMLAWMYENPHTHIRNWISERCQIAIKEKSDEIQRIQILLNRTREEVAKEYVTKQEVHADINRVLDRLDRLDEKLDRLMGARNAS